MSESSKEGGIRSKVYALIDMRATRVLNAFRGLGVCRCGTQRG